MFPVKTLYLLDEDFHDFCKHAQLRAAYYHVALFN